MIDRILSKWFVPKVEVDTLYAHLNNLAISYQEQRKELIAIRKQLRDAGIIKKQRNTNKQKADQ